MGIGITKEEERLVGILAADESFAANAVKYRSLLHEREQRESGDHSVRPVLELNLALDQAISERRGLRIVQSLGADVRMMGLAYQQVIHAIDSAAKTAR